MNAVDRHVLEQYLHAHIPLSRAMGVEVQQAGAGEVILGAPLAPNINHRDTVFGGSASAVAILAAWALLYVSLREQGINSRVVIQRNSTNYERPITGAFMAMAVVPIRAEWERFLYMLRRKGRARITVAVTLTCNGERVGAFEGDFVAAGNDPI